VLELRFGLNGGVPMTLEDIGRQFNVTRYVKPPDL
jgi:DNA-directed RNA polymerase sigma subunit (sigma70/sigma32)